MPPSAMTGIAVARAASAHSAIAVICGTPTPATMRVVQMEPAPTPTLTTSAPGLDQRLRALGRDHVARQHRHVRREHLDAADGLQHAGGVAVRRVHRERIHAGVQQQLQPLVQLRAHADRRRHQQPPALVGGRVGEVLLLEDVLVGDQPSQVEILVHQRQLLDAVLVEDRLGLFQRGAHGRGDQVLGGHVLRARALSCSVAKRMSRLVRMPTSLPSSVMGTPEMW